MLQTSPGRRRERSGNAGNGLDAGKANGSSGPETFRSFSANRKPWSPPKPALDPEKSAALRDQLLGELASLVSQEEATAWAQRALGAKNTLTTADSGLVDAAFASSLAGFADGEFMRNPCPRLRAPAMEQRRTKASVQRLDRLLHLSPAAIPALPCGKRVCHRRGKEHPREEASPTSHFCGGARWERGPIACRRLRA